MVLGLGLGLSKQRPADILFADAKALKDWHTAQGISLPLSRLARTSYRQDRAQAIRDGAGLPTGVAVGIEVGVTPGHSGILSVQSSPYNINNEMDAGNIAASGAGTQSDPYIIELKEFDGGGTAARGLNFNDSDADYYVVLRNCLFHDFANEGVKVNWSTARQVRIENCTFYNASGTGALIRRSGGNLAVEACVFSGCDTFGGYVDNSSSAAADVSLRNIKVTDDDAAWSAGGDVFQLKAASTVFDIRYVEIEASIGGNESVFQIMGCAPLSVISNVKFSGGFDYFLTDNDDTSIAKGFTLEHFDIADSRRELIHLQNLDGVKIRYGNAAHNAGGTNYRLIFLESDNTNSSVRVRNVDVDYLKMTKSTGTQVAGNEVLESWYGEDVRFRHCWVTDCVEDAYEHVYSLGGCTIEYCVSDNTPGQVADMFKVGKINGGVIDIVSDTSTVGAEVANYVHHIYGDTTSDHGVIISGCAYMFGHDIYVDTAGSTTNKAVLFFQDRDSSVVRNCHFAGPFSLLAQRSREAVVMQGGADVVAEYLDSQDAEGAVVPVYSGLNQFLDASDTALLSPASGALSNWNDKSFYNNAISQGTAADRPTSGLETQNGLNVISFDGSSDHVDRANLSFLNNSSAWTTVIVFKADDVITTGMLLSASVSSTDRIALAISSGEIRSGLYSGSSFAHSASEDVSVGTYYAAIVSYDGGSGFSFKLNDVAASKPSAPTTAANPNTLSLGAKPNAANALDGAIGEFRVYNRALSTGEQSALYAHLAEKWGI